LLQPPRHWHAVGTAAAVAPMAADSMAEAVSMVVVASPDAVAAVVSPAVAFAAGGDVALEQELQAA
jgi:hypothetical protein